MKAPWQSGAEVESFLFPGAGLSHRAEGDHHFIYRKAHMGDRDEEWIDAVVGGGEDGQVVASHNVRHIASITWKQ